MNAQPILQRLLLMLLAIGRSFQQDNLSQDNCKYEHPQTKYCRADFVVKVTIRPNLNATEIGQWWILPISIKTQIKTTPQFISLPDSALTELYVNQKLKNQLKPGSKYILSGKLATINSQRRLTANECSWVQLWPQVGLRHRAAMRKHKFDEACRCMINLTPSRNTTTTLKRRQVCQIDKTKLNNRSTQFFTKLQACYREHSHCGLRKPKTVKDGKAKKSDVCRWNKSRELSRCIDSIV